MATKHSLMPLNPNREAFSLTEVGPKCATSAGMKAIVNAPRTERDDFYISTIAPVNKGRQKPFRVMDSILLTVLLLETAFLARMLLAS
jgi:hypothetical protein